MAEHLAAEIWIGGKVSHSLVPSLCKAIHDEPVSLDWGSRIFRPQSGNDLREAVNNGSQGDSLLWLTDDQARWGQFELLEGFLRENSIPYDRRSSGKYDFDAEISSYRPGLGLYTWPTNTNGEPVVAGSTLQKIEKKLAAVVKSLQRGRMKQEKISLRVESILKQLRKELPPDLPPLPAFEVEGE
jgi:hypothetical protein